MQRSSEQQTWIINPFSKPEHIPAQADLNATLTIGQPEKKRNAPLPGLMINGGMAHAEWPCKLAVREK